MRGQAGQSQPHRLQAFICLAICGLVWGSPNVVIRFLRHDFDPFTQSFVRYLAAATALNAVLATVGRRHFPVLHKNWRMLVVPAFLLSGHQLLYMIGMYHTSAITGVLIAKLSAVLIPVMSYFVYEDERRIVRHPRFPAGTLLAAAGVWGLVHSGGALVKDTSPSGPWIILISVFLWSAYAVYIKSIVAHIHPLALSAVMPMISCVLFIPFVLVFGDFSCVFRASPSHLALLILSGILVIAIGNTCYYVALAQLGASATAGILFVTPLTTALLSRIFLGESLVLSQAAYGAALLAGCGLIGSTVTKARSGNVDTSQTPDNRRPFDEDRQWTSIVTQVNE